LGLRTSDEARILLVEDNLGDILLLNEAFKEGGVVAELKVVGNGEEALEFLQGKGKYEGEEQPDLILLDLNLPRMDGRTLLRRIKTTPEFRSIPVIVLSSSNLPTDIRESYDMAASCYIVKPKDLGGFFEVGKNLRDFWLRQVVFPSRVHGGGSAGGEKVG
jgi:CheY-like chemotaxis protein